MARFTKDEMRDELRTIFLYEADHIMLGRGSEMATAFIGFPDDDSGEYIDMSPSLVDLSRFDIASVFDRCFDYAFNPSPLNASDGSEVQDLHTFMEGTPRIGGNASQETHAFMTPDGLCRIVSDAAMARWSLDDHHGDLTVRDIALLADMSEGAVRNAISLADENGLQAIKGTKPVRIDGQVALRWLQSRRGFIPTPTSAKEDAFLAERIKSAVTVEELVTLTRRQAGVALGRSDEFLTKVGLDSWEALEADICRMDVGRARTFGEALEVDVPLFVGKAMELGLRRQMAEGGAA
ncbi:hypothetical protein [Methylobacterium bullatum]|uniref:Uncharacterized protein n=1 Tax=Methylobacterium bullatum TaxID=570505 RepID=A0A679JYN1_9HYPH|nr:hypothetical protein MBLL_01931 [Methylobacterium bullatum]